MKFFHLQIFLLALLPMALTDGQGEARRIAMIDPDKIKASLDYGAIEEIIKSRPEVEDLPTAVVSIAGVARSGKSFLLNLMANLLEHIERNNDAEGWEKSNQIIRGINWAQGRVTVTQGIWMWDKPFILTRDDGEKVAVLLVDTQGTGDNSRSPSLNTLLMYLSLQVSTVQMLNVWKYPTSNDLELLKLCADYKDLNKKDDDSLFSSLIFVLRDYQSSDNYGRDDSVLQSIKDQQPDETTRNIINGLLKAFKHLTSYNMPSPGRRITTASVNTEEWRLGDVETEFLRIAKELLMSSLQHGEVYWLKGTELLKHITSVELLLKELPEMVSSTEALEMSVLSKAFHDAKKRLHAVADTLSSTEFLERHHYNEVEKIFRLEANQVMEMVEKNEAAKKYSGSAWYKAQQAKFQEDEGLCWKMVYNKYISHIAEIALTNPEILSELPWDVLRAIRAIIAAAYAGFLYLFSFL